MMSDFINNNSSAIFSLLTLIVTLTIPMLIKRYEIISQKKSEISKRDKDTYDYLMRYLYEFYKGSNTLWTEIIISGENIGFMIVDGVSLSYSKVIELYLEKNYDIVFSMYVKSLNLDPKVINKLSPCVTNMLLQISTFKKIGTKDISDIRKEIGPLFSSFTVYFSQLRYAIKKLID